VPAGYDSSHSSGYGNRILQGLEDSSKIRKEVELDIEIIFVRRGELSDFLPSPLRKTGCGSSLHNKPISKRQSDSMERKCEMFHYACGMRIPLLNVIAYKTAPSNYFTDLKRTL
jgi:hypothetical protein